MIGVRILEERQSKYNGHLKVVKAWGLGTYIQAEGLTQSGGIVEDIWSRTLRRIHGSKFMIRDSLILGYGGGTVAKIINKLWPEAKITGVDIDPDIVELGEKYLGKTKAEVNIIDASDFLTHHSTLKTFDLIIVDTYLGDQYVEIIPKKANLVIFNRLFYGEKKLEALKFAEKLKKMFKKVDCFYPEANLMLICYA